MLLSDCSSRPPVLELENYDHTIERLLADTKKYYADYGSGYVHHGYEGDVEREELGRTHIVAFPYPYKIAELLEESNHEAIKAELEPFDDAYMTSFGHWATPYDAFIVRVKDEEGHLTPAAKVVADLVSRLEDYPILDEEDLSMRELDQLYESVANDIKRRDLLPLGGGPLPPPDELTELVIRYMSDKPRWDRWSWGTLEDNYAREDEVVYALEQLGYTVDK